MKNQKMIAITGASSSGKTKLAIEAAKALNGEIISVDSRQIYKELDIGSAKPSLEEREGIKHHLTDITDVENEYTVADFCDKAEAAIEEITSSGKIPILAGGTGLYFRVLLRDFDLPRVAPNKELRAELEQKSLPELFDMLLKLDFDLAQKIHPNNKVKIIRALEVCITLGIPMSKAQQKKENSKNVLWIGLDFEHRDILYERINSRVETMFDKGLEKEARNLFEKYPGNNILSNTIGYQEFIPYLNGETDLNEVKNKIKQNTRRYAKRQISWFNADKQIIKFNVENVSTDEIINYISSASCW